MASAEVFSLRRFCALEAEVFSLRGGPDGAAQPAPGRSLARLRVRAGEGVLELATSQGERTLRTLEVALRRVARVNAAFPAPECASPDSVAIFVWYRSGAADGEAGAEAGPAPTHCLMLVCTLPTYRALETEMGLWDALRDARPDSVEATHAGALTADEGAEVLATLRRAGAEGGPAPAAPAARWPAARDRQRAVRDAAAAYARHGQLAPEGVGSVAAYPRGGYSWDAMGGALPWLDVVAWAGEPEGDAHAPMPHMLWRREQHSLRALHAARAAARAATDQPTPPAPVVGELLDPDGWRATWSWRESVIPDALAYGGRVLWVALVPVRAAGGAQWEPRVVLLFMNDVRAQFAAALDETGEWRADACVHVGCVGLGTDVHATELGLVLGGAPAAAAPPPAREGVPVGAAWATGVAWLAGQFGPAPPALPAHAPASDGPGDAPHVVLVEPTPHQPFSTDLHAAEAEALWEARFVALDGLPQESAPRGVEARAEAVAAYVAMAALATRAHVPTNVGWVQPPSQAALDAAGAGR